MNLFSNSDMMNPLLKTNARRDRRFNFVIFVVWRALIVGRWLVEDCGGNYCFRLAEISPWVFLVFFEEGTQGESRVSFLGGLRSTRYCDRKGGAV